MTYTGKYLKNEKNKEKKERFKWLRKQDFYQEQGTHTTYYINFSKKTLFCKHTIKVDKPFLAR